MLNYFLKNDSLENEENSDDTYDYTNEEPIYDEFYNEDDYEENDSYTCD